MNFFKKLFIVVLLITYSFSTFVFSVKAYKVIDDHSEIFESILNNIRASCKDCENLTFEKMSNLSLGELREKCKNQNISLNPIYAISKLKTGIKHLSMDYGNEYREYFRLTAVNEILNFFKTKANYDQNKYTDDLFKTMSIWMLPCSIFLSIFTYLCISKNQKLKNKNFEKNKVSISNKLKFLYSGIMGIVGGIIGALLGWDRYNINKLNTEIKYNDYAIIKDNIKPVFKTEDWKDADLLEFRINVDEPTSSMAYFYKAGIDYTEEEQRYINENYKSLFSRVEETINNTYVQSDN